MIVIYGHWDRLKYAFNHELFSQIQQKVFFVLLYLIDGPTIHLVPIIFIIFLKVGHSRPLFIYFCLFNTADNKQMFNKILPMTGVEPWTSGIKSDRSTNWATTTSQSCTNYSPTKFEPTLYLPKSVIAISRDKKHLTISWSHLILAMTEPLQTLAKDLHTYCPYNLAPGHLVEWHRSYSD